MFEKISNFKTEWAPCADYFEKLSQFYYQKYFEGILQQPNHRKQSIQIYSIVYNLCTQKNSRSERIYSCYDEILKKFLQHNLRKFQNQYHLLDFFIRLWVAYSKFSAECTSKFSYLDRYYLSDNNLPSLNTKAAQNFDEFVLNQHHRNLFFQSFVKQWALIRSGQNNMVQTLKEMGEILKELDKLTGFKHNELLWNFVKEAIQNFYKEKHQQWKQLDCHAYLTNINDFYQLELNLIRAATVESQKCIEQTKETFKSIFLGQLLQKIFQQEQGFKLMLSKRDFQKCKLVYRTVRQFQNLETLKKQYYLFIRHKGFEFFSELTSDMDSFKIISKFYNFYLDYQKFTIDAFENSKQMFLQFRTATEAVVNFNDEQYKISYHMASFADSILKTILNEQKVLEIFCLFDCLSSKDLFMEQYENHLSQRLLSSNHIHIDNQKYFVQQLKSKCGDSFTKKVEEKIYDYIVSLQQTREFNLHINTGIDFSIKLVNKQSWIGNSQPKSGFIGYPLNLPTQLSQLKYKFQSFYYAKYTKRYLELLPMQGDITLLVRLNHNQMNYCEINMNLLQGLLLMYIQSCRTIVKLEQIVDAFKINQSLIKFYLAAISAENTSQLVYQTSEGYVFNQLFSTQSKRIKLEINRYEKNERKESFNIERDIAIEAIIVRTMKIHKRMQLMSLIEQISSYPKLLSKPTTSKIKSAIEKLIEKEFLDRQENDHNVFIYKP